MTHHKVYVTINEESEWNAKDAGVFRGCGCFSFAGCEYVDGNAIAEYDIDVYDDEDIDVIKNNLDSDGEVISFDID